MLETGHIEWWYQRSRVFHIECRFSIYAIFCEELVDCSPEKFSIDQDVEWYTVLVAVQQVVYECGQFMAGQGWSIALVTVFVGRLSNPGNIDQGDYRSPMRF